MTASMPDSTLSLRCVSAFNPAGQRVNRDRPTMLVAITSVSIRSGSFFPSCPILMKHVTGFAMQWFA